MEPTPISILTGFLGSGKTTLLRRALASPGMHDTAIVVNEFGAIGLDHLLVAASTDEIVQLPSGCLCCAVRQDLVRTVHRLLARRQAGDISHFRRIAVETSGLAEPAPILHTLAADAELERMLRFDRVLTVIDSVYGLTTLDRHAEATAQAVLADRLVISKADFAPPSDALLARLAVLNPAASISLTTDPAAEAMLFGGAFDAVRQPPRRFWSAASHTHGIETVAIALDRPMSRLDFAVALGGLARERGEDLLRVKGLIAFADTDGRPAAVHAVQHSLYAPEWLDDWPDTDRTSRMVFITRAIPAEAILARFAAGAPRVLAG